MKKKILFWTPRILCILCILLVMLFSLDAFGPGLTLREQITGFLMHNIPAFILIIFLVLAWKWELVGAIFFTCAALFAAGYLTDLFVRNLGVLVLCVPFLIVGILFYWYYYLYRNVNKGG